MSISRRDVIKGISCGAGATVLTPILQQLKAYADGNAKTPRRFVFVLLGNGLNPELFVPEDIERDGKRCERLQDVSLTDVKLSPVMSPLEPFKDCLTIVHNLSGKVCGGGHSTDWGALGVFPYAKGVWGETVDWVLAKTAPAIFPRVGLGISGRPGNAVIYNCSARGKNQPLPTICRPDIAYRQLFGSVATGEARTDYQLRGQTIDFLAQDIHRIERQLAGPERDKFAAHVQALEALTTSRKSIEGQAAVLQRHAPAGGDKFSSDVETDRLESHFEIGAAALASGLTNVLTIASGVNRSHFTVTFHGLGLDINTHQIGHGKGFGDKTAKEWTAEIRRYHCELIAGLARRLQAVPEGNGTVLDNTVIVFLSDGAESHHSTCLEWPFVILGDLGGALKTHGRFLEFPAYGKQGHRTTANLYTTLLHAAGAPRDRFGLPDPDLRDIDQDGPLSELMA